MNTVLFLQVMEKLGVRDVGSYFRRMWIAVVPCALIGMVLGVTYGTWKGLLIGTVIGIVAPALLIWLAVTLVHIAIHLFFFTAAWAAIIYCALYVIRWWL
jgi:hypothetical protein